MLLIQCPKCATLHRPGRFLPHVVGELLDDAVASTEGGVPADVAVYLQREEFGRALRLVSAAFVSRFGMEHTKRHEEAIRRGMDNLVGRAAFRRI